MYNVKNDVKYYICYKQKYEIIEYIKVEVDKTPILEGISDNFDDVLIYFAKHYLEKYEMCKKFYGFASDIYFWKRNYLNNCYVVNSNNQIIYPSVYHYEIVKLIEKGKINDLNYKSNFENFSIYHNYPWMRNKKKKFHHQYEFRKDPVPGTGCKYDTLNDYYHTTTIIHNDRFLREIENEEILESGYDYELPHDRKKSRKKYRETGWKCRYLDSSWKTNSKMKKQWMKHKKNVTNHSRKIYDETWEDTYYGNLLEEDY